MSEEAIKLDARLYVIEFFVASLFAMTCLQTWPDEPSESFDKIRNQMIEGCRKRTFPEFDPAMSDLLSAELETAGTRLSAMVSEQIDLVLEARKARKERL